MVYIFSVEKTIEYHHLKTLKVKKNIILKMKSCIRNQTN